MIRLILVVFTAIVLIQRIENTAAEQWITGKVTHIGFATIDENVQAEVSLRDVSLMDVASKLIASTKISNPKTFPFSYKLQYNSSDIKPSGDYALSAMITGPGDKLLYINDVRTTAPLMENSSPTIDIAVIRVGEPPKITKTRSISPKICPPVECPKPKICPYGYEKKDDCEICRCNDPCNPPGRSILCGPNKRCFIEKKPDGTFGTRCDTASSEKSQGPTKEDCKLPKVVGLCKAAFPRFYYNSETENCERFTYGGCRGNANNFETQSECEELCQI